MHGNLCFSVSVTDCLYSLRLWLWLGLATVAPVRMNSHMKIWRQKAIKYHALNQLVLEPKQEPA